MPAGFDVTLPLPVPVIETVRVYEFLVNNAVTLLSESMVIVAWLFVPAAAPDHPLKLEVASGTAVNVTVASAGNAAVHVAPHEIPAGAELTVPPPIPDLATVRV
jgi:hypothetical protein